MSEPRTLDEVLAGHARLGFFGPGSVLDGIEHARGFLRVLRPAGRVLDLGSGGGLPGLVIAVGAPDVRVVLLDVSERRTDALRRAVSALTLGPRVEVWCGRAEEFGRDERCRGSFDAVVSRGFGRPALTAECAAPFLALGGQLVVSEPPDDRTGRWPASGVSLVGLTLDQAGSGAFASLTQTERCPDRFPRRTLRPDLF